MTAALAMRATKVKLNVDQFDLLAESGGLRGLERSELLDGDIYLMSAQYRRHAYAKSVLYEALLDWTRANRPSLRVMSEASVAMPPSDEPMPDLIVTDQPRGRKAIPVGSVALLVEIADGTREYDLGYKADLYARQGVPEYWVVDLQEGCVVRHAGPLAEGYSKRDSFELGATVVAETLLDLTADTTTLID